MSVAFSMNRGACAFLARMVAVTRDGMVQARELSLQGSRRTAGRLQQTALLFPTTAPPTIAPTTQPYHLDLPGDAIQTPTRSRPQQLTPDTSPTSAANSNNGLQRHFPDSESGGRRLHDPRRDRAILAFDKRVRHTMAGGHWEGGGYAYTGRLMVAGRQGVILAVYLFIFGLATAYLGSYYTMATSLGVEVRRC